MGSDKASIELSGATLLERAVEVLAATAPRVLLACGSRPRYAELGCELVLDARVDAGPLAGLEAALEVLEADGGGWLGVLACDMPGARAEILRLCLERASLRDLDVVVVEGEAGVEPLLGVVHTRALAAVRAALDRGERRMISFHDSVRAGSLRLDELPADLRDGGPTRNLNTPEDLDQERKSRP